MSRKSETDKLIYRPLDIVVRDVEFESNEEVLRFWAEGWGTPKPFTYHPGLEKAFTTRGEDLDRQEKLLMDRVRRMCDNRLIGLEPPFVLAKPPMAMPGLYHLRYIVPNNVEVL